ncbi:hypothetical protein [Halorussus lipolyticus]|uniref:hypothetical protein n=1 Tax=Halorussus lipolyticus TaxID=3034024 RepID=UPI0023E84B09|nr:hypothetical protein [Halorussus sp. DT80]
MGGPVEPKRLSTSSPPRTFWRSALLDPDTDDFDRYRQGWRAQFCARQPAKPTADVLGESFREDALGESFREDALGESFHRDSLRATFHRKALGLTNHRLGG